ncbi:KGG domain-containing protein [Noviherbaspirillum suwonense]|uniref:Stress-induced acidophilic repeat motif-containing protein n=1 Tax=Noviherbaspirillum suwonense TaxID=1224511 RepID=A0ABY1PYB7_9BURK|nr:KGG domain-containing protein [Noviherbaspirillum suwonense]SMP48940.1 Stress-induced acidophilic repeat motif-containing protein [Noviherbaspirillum suwonense]
MASTKQDVKEQGKQGERTSRRGFASMDPNQQRAIASAGGRAAHLSGNAHEFTSEEARRAGSMSRKNSANRGRAAQAGGADGAQAEVDTAGK